jgi:hypothetical protein
MDEFFDLRVGEIVEKPEGVDEHAGLGFHRRLERGIQEHELPACATPFLQISGVL